MRFGLLALSIAMLGSGGLAAQSALAISSNVISLASVNAFPSPSEYARHERLRLAKNRERHQHLAMR